MKILIADDEQVSRMVLERTLRALNYEVDAARDGAEAWSLYRQHRYPIVIADWVMPDMDGIELCRRIRAAGSQHYSYVILLTSKFEKQDRLTGLSAGADDFIVKPFDRGELSARLGVAERILSMESQLREANDRIEQIRRQEVEIGARIQRALLMARPPEGPCEFEFAAMNLPSSQIDGDFFDFFVHSPSVVDLFVGDAMGKGIPAALVGAGAKSTLLRTVGRLLTQRNGDDIPSPQSIVQTANGTLAKELIRLNSFVTLEYARFNAHTRIATIVDCGHTKSLHFRTESHETSEISGNNFPIGFVETERYEEIEVPFGTGDIFCFYSDGVTDAMSPDGEAFGLERLTELVTKNGDESPSMLLYQLREAVRIHTLGRDLDDDFTVLLVRIGQSQTPWQEEVHVFGSTLDSLAEIRAFVGTRAMECGLSGSDVDRLQLAAHEATTNIVLHAHGAQGGEIEYRAIRLPEGMSIRIVYAGPDFVPGEVPQPDVTLFGEGGYGLYIIQQCVDRIEYGTEGTGARFIEMTKRSS